MYTNIQRSKADGELVILTLAGQHLPRRVVRLIGSYQAGLYCFDPVTGQYEIGVLEKDEGHFDPLDDIQQYRDYFKANLEAMTGLQFLRAGVMVIQNSWDVAIKSIEIDGLRVATYNTGTLVLTPELKVTV